jgi:hypothetical protein
LSLRSQFSIVYQQTLLTSLPFLHFRGERLENLAKHVGLFHCKLDECLYDAELVYQRRNQYHAKLLEVDADVQCPVCDRLMPKPRLREHCAKHFAEEVMEIVTGFDNPSVCQLCELGSR